MRAARVRVVARPQRVGEHGSARGDSTHSQTAAGDAATAAHIVASKPDLVVLVDFGVFNLRLARQLRRIDYAGPILDVFPPGNVAG